MPLFATIFNFLEGNYGVILGIKNHEAVLLPCESIAYPAGALYSVNLCLYRAVYGSDRQIHGNRSRFHSIFFSSMVIQ